jgi:DNA-directed RNA polymerase subunit omega
MIEAHQTQIEVDEPEADSMSLLMSQEADKPAQDDMSEERLLRELMQVQKEG